MLLRAVCPSFGELATFKDEWDGADVESEGTRLLPATARHVLLNLLWYEAPVKLTELALWVRERKSEGGAAGERRCVALIRRPRAAMLLFVWL